MCSALRSLAYDAGGKTEALKIKPKGKSGQRQKQQNANADNGEAAFAEGDASTGAPSATLWIVLGVVIVAAATGLTVYFVRRKRKGV